MWVTSGSVFDVIVDLRKSSQTFGQWEGHVLDAESHRRLWVPAGCAHGFLVLSETCDFLYKVTKPYNPEADRSLRWNDDALAIGWPLEPGTAPILSAKDEKAAGLAECDKYP